MRAPKIENKYNPNVKSVYNLQVADRSKIGATRLSEMTFGAYGVYRAAWGTDTDKQTGTDATYWIGIFDEDAPFFTGGFEFQIDLPDGRNKYGFAGFYIPEEIENENDLLIQEMFLEKLNWLLDTGILKMGDE